jgi:DNA-binding CsgD family transcriptional regulator/tetratricopeptide (TPR) repeat protein
VVVGREVELDHLVRAVGTVRAGASRSVFLVGEAGIGKTRLLSEIAAEGRHLGMAVMTGRAPVTTPVAFSVLAEALRTWLRGHEREPTMPPYDAGLRLVLPEWPAGGAGAGLSDAQLRLLALEGVVRLVQRIAADAGALVLLDDLHAADADSLEAIRYLVTAAPERVLLVGSLRGHEVLAPEQVVRSLARDGLADVYDLEPLERRAVAELLGALLDAQPPAELVEDVIARTDGVPLLVEELLDSHVRSGSVTVGEHGARWRGGSTVVSRSVRDMVEARLERLTGQQREVVVAGAVVGDFETGLLARVAQQRDVDIGDAIVAATNAGLLETTGRAVAFRHALIRDAALGVTLPHVRQTLNRRTADALADRGNGDATLLERRAHHLEQIGESDHAGQLLTMAAGCRIDEHALLSAEALALAALELTTDVDSREAAADALARALARQGRWSEALARDQEADDAYGPNPTRLRRMATCAIEMGQPERAGTLVADGIAAGDSSPQLHVLAGRVAMAAGRADDALAAAERAFQAAANDPEARCAALDVRGRALDYTGHRDDARAAWTRQAEEAAAANLTDARLRAVVQLSKLEVFEGSAPDRLFEARDLARDAGALVEQSWAEENLAIALAIQGDPDAAARILDEAVPRCRALRLDQLPYLLVAQGGVASYRGDEAVEALFAEAERLAPTADLAIHSYGLRADIALRAGRYDEALDWCERTVEMIRSMPGGMPSDTPCWLVLAYAVVGRNDAAHAALAEARALPGDLARWHGRPVVLAAAEAILNGDDAGVDAALASATGRMPFDLALLRVLAAEIVGGPARARWLREALDLYESAGESGDAPRVRRLLREAGGSVPRRRRTTGAVPDAFAAHGVTAREAEVLQLLGDGLTNAAIAERLFISVRTVETHVSSLLTKLHVETRGQLTALSATIGDGHSA